jgi:hypothetical protein
MAPPHGRTLLIYELRIYNCLPGRLPALLKRFENDTLKLWDKHGIQQAGFWTTTIGESNNDLTYMIRWESMADREARWGAFIADPEWHAARDKSEADGPIIATLSSQLLTPTAFSRAS